MRKFGIVINVVEPCFWSPNDEIYQVWKKTIEQIEADYNKLIGLGTTPQEARSVLPNSLKSSRD